MTRLTRRDLMRTAGASSASALFSPAIIREANAQSSFDWKRFAGQKIDVLYVKNTRADLLVAKNKEFEALTGIQVSAEAIPEQQQRQKVDDRVHLGQADLRRGGALAACAEAHRPEGQVARPI